MLNNNIVTVILLAITCCRVNSQDEPTVTTDSGKIRGHYLVSPSGKRYKAFEGIPFAEKPVDILRFQPPIPVKPWSGELLANKFKGVCMGFSRSSFNLNFSVEGSEDCLYLNIYVPEQKIDKPLPIIFWIYGGAFQMCTLTGSEQKYLVEQDVIFVSFNHRHGILGFLSTEDEVVSGNMGLKDQALALKWVYNNIKNFGGDPKQINLIGFSSGAASVHYLYLSPMTAGMFRSGISISGTALHSWAQTKNPREKAISIAEFLKCPTNDMVQMIACFRKQTAQALMMAQSIFYPWILYDITPFGPVVEKSKDKPFIDQNPIDIINSGKAQKVPWITGMINNEALLDIAGFITNKSSLQELDKNWTSIAPDLLDYKFVIPKDQQAQVSNQIRKHYFADKPISGENVQILVNLITDKCYGIDSEAAARAMAKANPKLTWFYYYTYKAANSISDIVINRTKTKDFTMKFGPSHGDDVFLTFQSFPIGPALTKEDLSMHAELVKFWLSVTKMGSAKDFKPEWANVDAAKASLDYLHMAGPGDLKPKQYSNLGDKDFWKTINTLK